jgi:hypothetical protein
MDCSNFRQGDIWALAYYAFRLLVIARIGMGIIDALICYNSMARVPYRVTSGHVFASFPALLDSPLMPDQENLSILLLEDVYLHLLSNKYYLPTYSAIRRDSFLSPTSSVSWTTLPPFLKGMASTILSLEFRPISCFKVCSL